MFLDVDTHGQGPGLLHVQLPAPVAVIGDIHGRADLLDRLLERLPNDIQIVVVGDLCDRGPDTQGVIQRLVENNAIGVRGNHDVWLLRWAQGRGFDRAAVAMGGEATLTSYGSVGQNQQEIDAEGILVPDHHRQWLETLALALDLCVAGERYWVTHAGVSTSHSFAGLALSEVVPWLVERHPADLLWAYVDPENALPLDAPVVHGHVVRAEPLDSGSVIALDTGSGQLNGRLSAVVLPERRFVTVG
jgi:serine/threonine protein phosphatase 1